MPAIKYRILFSAKTANIKRITMKLISLLNIREGYDKIKKEVLNGPRESFNLYWTAYGGRNKLFLSFYLWLAILLGALLAIFGIFTAPWKWYDDVLTIIPSILGFSLGGYAILIGFGDANFFNIICGKLENEKASLYMRVNASFFHFIFIQFISLIFAIFIRATGFNLFILNLIGITLFMYALLTIVSTCFAVLNLASWFDMTIQQKNKRKQNR